MTEKPESTDLIQHIRAALIESNAAASNLHRAKTRLDVLKTLLDEAHALLQQAETRVRVARGNLQVFDSNDVNAIQDMMRVASFKSND